MREVEKPELTIGFVPLTSCAPLVVAKERGFFVRRGLEVVLSREASWASVRDRLAYGEFDAAQMLAPMPVALTLGLAGLRRETVVPLALDLNGNGITVSTALHAMMRDAVPDLPESGPVPASALARVIAARQRHGMRRLVFAHVYPFSTHHYQLRAWLRAGGIEPGRDLDLVVVPPPQMVAGLEAGRVDGYCVGEPWNQQAVRSGLGRLLATSSDIWPDGTEKVLGVLKEWAERHPRTLAALMEALLEAAAWVDRLENRLETARLLARDEYVRARLERLAYPLLGYVQEEADRPLRHLPDAHVFHRRGANLPRPEHALWYGRWMHEAGQLDAPLDEATAAAVYRPDLYKAVLREAEMPGPAD